MANVIVHLGWKEEISPSKVTPRWTGVGGGGDGEREGDKIPDGCALAMSYGLGIGLAVSVLDSRGQCELEDAEPSTQGKKEAV